jgi:hypothetical protein
LQVDAIEQWAGNTSAIASHDIGRAGAQPAWITGVAAWTRIHRCQKLESRWELGLSRGTRNDDVTGFQRLPQYIEDAAIEFRQFVKEQYAVVSQRDFAGSRSRSSADQRDC